MKYLHLILLQGCSTFKDSSPIDVNKIGFNGKMNVQPYLIYCDYIISVSERDACSHEFLIDYIVENLDYPEEAKEREIECNVLSQFIIKSDGSISDIEILETCGEEFSTSVMTLIKNMPEWKPGTYKKKPVDIKYILPLKFKLSSD